MQHHVIFEVSAPADLRFPETWGGREAEGPPEAETRHVWLPASLSRIGNWTPGTDYGYLDDEGGDDSTSWENGETFLAAGIVDDETLDDVLAYGNNGTEFATMGSLTEYGLLPDFAVEHYPDDGCIYSIRVTPALDYAVRTSREADIVWSVIERWASDGGYARELGPMLDAAIADDRALVARCAG